MKLIVSQLTTEQTKIQDFVVVHASAAMGYNGLHILITCIDPEALEYDPIIFTLGITNNIDDATEMVNSINSAIAPKGR